VRRQVRLWNMFGTELRRRRIEAGLSLAALTRLVFYSKSHLSKVETGAKRPTVEFARRCDAVLGCDGVLAALVERDGRPEKLEPAVTSDAARAVGSGAGFAPIEVDGSALEPFRLWFAEVRGYGQRLPAASLIPMLTAHTRALCDLAGELRGADQTEALLQAARVAEYTGWMAQESGQDEAAVWWTDRAVELGNDAGDRGMAAYAKVRRALISLYQSDAGRTIALAQDAQRAGCRPRIRGLAAQREAQGHALAGDRRACFEALDRARELLAADPATPGEPVIGSSHVADPAALAAGWSLFDLGRPEQAAQILRDELARIPAHAYRARSRAGARLALSLAGAGELAEACLVADKVLDAYANVGSATVRTDLRRLAGALRRWPGDPAARRLGVRLTETVTHHRWTTGNACRTGTPVGDS
jgi:transcriptional regulator with XRE-family HTH domain